MPSLIHKAQDVKNSNAIFCPKKKQPVCVCKYEKKLISID